MSNQTKENPYELDHGYQTRHDYAITGYGITVSSILHWLFENNSSTEPTGFPYQYEDAMDEEYTAFFETALGKCNINYVQTSNAGVEAIMMYDVSADDTPVTVPTQSEINQQIVKAIIALYQVPAEKQYSLDVFIEKYVGYINIVDYC